MLGENIKKLRQKNKLSREKLGAFIGMTGRNIFLIEIGEVENPGIKTVKKFSDFFDVSIDSLLK